MLRSYVCAECGNEHLPNPHPVLVMSGHDVVYEFCSDECMNARATREGIKIIG